MRACALDGDRVSSWDDGAVLEGRGFIPAYCASPLLESLRHYQITTFGLDGLRTNTIETGVISLASRCRTHDVTIVDMKFLPSSS